MTTVLIHPATHDTVRPAIDRAFEIFPINLSGKKVLIKPNALRTSRADEAIVTHPSVLRAVVEKVETLNPETIIVGDNPGVASYGANEECFEKTGLMAAAKGYYQNIGNDSVKVDFNPAFMDTVSVSKIVMDADIIISLPRFKTHGLTVVSGALKNSYGFLCGAQKAKQDGLGDYDLNTINIIGKLEKIPDFNLPLLSGEGVSENQAIQKMLTSKISFLPKVDQSLCTACGTCVDQCPVSALEMIDDFPKVDANTCITCFCCQELCPEKAIQLG